MSKRVFKPKQQTGREWERWQIDVSQQVDAGQPLSDNEMLTYFGAEPSPAADNSTLSERVDSLEKLLHTMVYNDQTALDAIRLARDNEMLLWMGDNA